LLHPTGMRGVWKQWFEAAGIHDAVAPANSGTFDVHAMLVRAAESGLGIALVPDIAVTEATWRRGVVVAWDLSIPREDAHYLVYPKHLLGTYPFEPFRQWLLEEAQTYAARLQRKAQHKTPKPRTRRA